MRRLELGLDKRISEICYFSEGVGYTHFVLVFEKMVNRMRLSFTCTFVTLVPSAFKITTIWRFTEEATTFYSPQRPPWRRQALPYRAPLRLIGVPLVISVQITAPSIVIRVKLSRIQVVQIANRAWKIFAPY